MESEWIPREVLLLSAMVLLAFTMVPLVFHRLRSHLALPLRGKWLTRALWPLALGLLLFVLELLARR